MATIRCTPFCHARPLRTRASRPHRERYPPARQRRRRQTQCEQNAARRPCLTMNTPSGFRGIAKAPGLKSVGYEIGAGIPFGEGSPIGIAFGEARSAGIAFGEGASAEISFHEGESAGITFREARQTQNRQILPRQTVFQQKFPRQTENQQTLPRQMEFRSPGPRQTGFQQKLPRQTGFRSHGPRQTGFRSHGSRQTENQQEHPSPDGIPTGASLARHESVRSLVTGP